MPDVPTSDEAGIPGLYAAGWFGLFGPKGIPKPVIAKLNAATNAALQGDAMRIALSKLGAQPRGGKPEDLTQHIQRETEKWKPIVVMLNLKVD